MACDYVDNLGGVAVSTGYDYTTLPPPPAEVGEELARLEEVSAGYDGRTVVSHVDLTVRSDSFVAVVGPNGGGKTTLVRLLLRQLHPTHGRVWLKPGLRIGYMPQMASFDMDFPIVVRDVVRMGRKGSCWPTRDRTVEAEVDRLIEFANLGAVADRRIGQLSGGQRQRVLLCRALMGSPEMLVMDEPVTYMDRNSETTLYRLLPELQKRMAIVLVSHDVGTVAGMAKSIACVNGSLRYHPTATITPEVMNVYGCHVEVVGHGSAMGRAPRQ